MSVASSPKSAKFTDNNLYMKFECVQINVYKTPLKPVSFLKKKYNMAGRDGVICVSFLVVYIVVATLTKLLECQKTEIVVFDSPEFLMLLTLARWSLFLSVR